jgi:hypothetical protein
MYALQEIVIDKSVPFADAFIMAQQIIQNTYKLFYTETDHSWRFRNLPKTQFIRGSYKRNVVTDVMTVVYGKLKGLDEA